MTIQLRLPVAAAAMASLLSISGLALAQPAAPAGSAGPPSHAQWAEHMQAHREARIHALHDLLNIHPDQEVAFQAFVSSMHPDKDAQRHHEGEGAPQQALTTPQRLDRMTQRMAEHQAAFQHRADAVRTFYAALTPDQQRAFDAMHGVMGRHDMGHGMHGHGGFGGPERG